MGRGPYSKSKRHKSHNTHALAIVRRFFPSVTEVHDADEDFSIQVTANDSKVARTKDHNNCAMAVAVKRAAKARGVIISVKKAYIIKKERAIRYNLPESVSREIVSFDRKAGFAEGSYNLATPKGSSRIGSHYVRDRARAAKASPSSNHNKRKAAKPHFTSNIRTSLISKES